MFDRDIKSDQYFLETQMGIVTQSGNWFHTTSEHLESFAPGLLEKVPLKKLIQNAEAWIKSADSLALILLYALLIWSNPWLAAAIALLFHWLWYHYKSGFVIRGVAPFLRFINSDGFLFVIAFISLSYLGFQQAYLATGIGIVYFFMLKPGFLCKGWDKLNKTGADELTPNDKVLKMIIIKQAMRHNSAPADVQKMEERLKELALNRKKGDG